MGWYSSYRGRSVGRVLHAIDTYCGLKYAEQVQVNFRPTTIRYCREGCDIGELTYYQKPFATFTWKEDYSDIPVIEFDDSLGDLKTYFEKQQEEKGPYLDDMESYFNKVT